LEHQIEGLSTREADERRRQGRANTTRSDGGRSYASIVRANLFGLFNNILFAIGIALVALGRYNDAITSVGIALVNACIATIQELRAKRKLEQIALLTRPTVTVVRDRAERAVDASELVEGDVLAVRAGDQIVVDGPLLAGAIEVDESQLTGEPDLIRKQPGDALFSGSFCVTGQGLYEARQVGAASFANKLAASARQFQLSRTPLQRRVDLVVRVVMVVVAVFSIIIFGAALLEGLPAVRLAQIAAVLSGQVPYGLFLMIAVAYALGASTIARQGALTQQSNAIESLSSIDVLCTDKTGTLTANRMRFHALVALDGGVTAEEAQAALGDLVRSAAQGNATSEAITAGVAGRARPLADEVAFASARKWSAVAFGDGVPRGVFVLGAAEMLRDYLPPDALGPASALSRQAQAWSEQGLRVLLLAGSPEATTLHDAAGEIVLPRLRPLALVSLSDELRPQVRETIAAFRELGVDVKGISGDDPQTVAALARQAGFPHDLHLVSGPQLAALEPAAFDAASTTASIFGRITPEQKEQLVDALLRSGKRVAMIGDGVNDVLSLKKASLGIAMQSGSGATRNVADMVLLNDSFAALPPAFHEGRRIIGGMTSALYLFLTRVTTTTLIIIAVTMLGLSFPFDPAQVALTTFTVGIPAFFLTIWARPRPLPPRLLADLARFVFPVAIITMLIGVGFYVMDYNWVLEGVSSQNIPSRALDDFAAYTGISLQNADTATVAAASATIAAQSSLSIFISYTAFLLILFLEPPHRFFLGWRRRVSPDKRPTYLAAGLFLLFQLIHYVQPIGVYFGIITKPEGIYLMILGLVVVWFFVIRAAWRWRLFERLLGLDA
jgi:cation-transporting P-type ATPase E